MVNILDPIWVIYIYISTAARDWMSLHYHCLDLFGVYVCLQRLATVTVPRNSPLRLATPGK